VRLKGQRSRSHNGRVASASGDVNRRIIPDVFRLPQTVADSIYTARRGSARPSIETAVMELRSVAAAMQVSL